MTEDGSVKDFNYLLAYYKCKQDLKNTNTMRSEFEDIKKWIELLKLKNRVSEMEISLVKINGRRDLAEKRSLNLKSEQQKATQ